MVLPIISPPHKLNLIQTKSEIRDYVHLSVKPMHYGPNTLLTFIHVPITFE